MKIIIGTRGSKLALAQADWVARRLREMGAEVSLQVVRTTYGGRPPHAVVGVFVREIEQALLHREVSLAVHSLKDLPTGLRAGLRLAAVPEREDPRDALVMSRGAGYRDLPIGARVASGSVRRSAQLRAHRPDLAFVSVRGNVDTRLRKLARGEFDALVVAAAGLVRLGMADRITERLPTELSLPAPGQGALALQTREDDETTYEFVSRLDHDSSRAAVTAERAFLARLGGGCTIPAAALATVTHEVLLLEGLVADAREGRLIRDSVTGSADQPEQVGVALAELLLGRGAEEMLRAQ